MLVLAHLRGSHERLLYLVGIGACADADQREPGGICCPRAEPERGRGIDPGGFDVERADGVHARERRRGSGRTCRPGRAGAAGSGGGGGGGQKFCSGNPYNGGGGGGVGLFGLCSNGTAGSVSTTAGGGGGGSGGGNGGTAKGLVQPGAGGSAATGVSGQGTGSAGTAGAVCTTPRGVSSGRTTTGGGKGGVSGAVDHSCNTYFYANTAVRGGAGGGGGGGAFGGGGGSGTLTVGGVGGGLGYKNNITIVPGNSYTVVVGSGGAGGLDAPTCYYSCSHVYVKNERGTGGSGGSGAVRIVWPGNTRQFPGTCVGTP